MITLHLVRHGETEWHAENKYAGHTDISLTERGREQSRELVSWSLKVNPVSIHSSDLSRAIDTARPSAEALGLNLQIDDRLREVNFGEIEGLTPAEMESQYPVLRKEFVEFPASTLMPGGESGRLALARAMPSIREIVDAAGQGDVVVVCHGTLLRLIACELLGIDLNEYRRAFPAIPNVGHLSLEIIESPDSQGSGLKGSLIQ